MPVEFLTDGAAAAFGHCYRHPGYAVRPQASPIVRRPNALDDHPHPNRLGR
jgi:hypothetical protein